MGNSISNAKHLLINNKASILEAMNQLNITAKRILFVVDENERFIGTVTDGDIRRYILRTGSLDGRVEDACNKNPLFGTHGYNKAKLIEKARQLNIFYIPILSDDKRIAEIITLEEVEVKPSVSSLEPLNIPAVIMAGGFGTRLEPITKVIPKPLIPVGDKTILEHIMEKLAQYGINEFWISVNYKAYMIKSYLSELNLPYRINYVQEEKPLGTAGSLYLLKGKIQSSFFILTNCDVIVDIDYLSLVEFHSENENDITVVASAQHYRIPYGVCEIEEGSLKRIVEKPEVSLLVNTGMYVINSSMLELIPENEFFHATDMIARARAKNKKIGIYPISENSWIDIGQWEEYKKAINKIKL